MRGLMRQNEVTSLSFRMGSAWGRKIKGAAEVQGLPYLRLADVGCSFSGYAYRQAING